LFLLLRKDRRRSLPFKGGELPPSEFSDKKSACADCRAIAGLDIIHAFGNADKSMHKLKGGIMSHTLSQPEEVNHALMEMARKDMQADIPVTDKENLFEGTQKSWRGSYVSPYRAAYMKSKQGLLDS
jgi:hypothetical protein